MRSRQDQVRHCISAGLNPFSSHLRRRDQTPWSMRMCLPSDAERIVARRTGEFDERVFCGLDFVLAEAARRGLKVMLVLINYWKARSAARPSSSSS